MEKSPFEFKNFKDGFVKEFEALALKYGYPLWFVTVGQVSDAESSDWESWGNASNETLIDQLSHIVEELEND